MSVPHHQNQCMAATEFTNDLRERSCSVVECLTRHIYPSLVLVQPRKTRPCLTERLLMGRKESNQTNNYQWPWKSSQGNQIIINSPSWLYVVSLQLDWNLPCCSRDPVYWSKFWLKFGSLWRIVGSFHQNFTLHHDMYKWYIQEILVKICQLVIAISCSHTNAYANRIRTHINMSSLPYLFGWNY